MNYIEFKIIEYLFSFLQILKVLSLNHIYTYAFIGTHRSIYVGPFAEKNLMANVLRF